MIEVGLISAGLVSAFLIDRLFFWKRSTMNMATPIVRGHAFWARKLITDPAVLKMKPTIEPIRPGRIEIKNYDISTNNDTEVIKNYGFDPTMENTPTPRF